MAVFTSRESILMDYVMYIDVEVRLIGYSWDGCGDADMCWEWKLVIMCSLSRVNACCMVALSSRSKELLFDFL